MKSHSAIESVYAVVFMDAIHFHVRSEGSVVKRAVYVAIGIREEVLGMCGSVKT